MSNKTTIETISDTEIRIEREFDVPRDLVWEAYTDPELFAQWIGPRGIDIEVETMDVTEGGSYRYKTPESTSGDEYAFFGEYRVVEPPKVLESTFNYSGATSSPNPVIDRVELTELDGGSTKLVAISTHTSKEDRDGMLESGMEKGVREGYEKLDELLVLKEQN